MLKYIVKRDGRIVPFNKEKITMAVLQAAVAVGGRNRETAEKITKKVLLNLGQNKYRESYPTVEEIQDLVEKALIKEGHAKTAKAYIVYRYEHELKRAGRKSLTYSSDNIPYKKLWEALDWSVNNNCIYLSQLNDYINKDCFKELVRASENFYSGEISNVLGQILERKDDLKFIIIAGPSSSGKTTTTIKLRDGLRKNGLNTIMLNIDNYFYDLTMHPRDSAGDYDFETPEAIELELLKKHLKALYKNKTINSPVYNFKTGRREENTIEIKSGKNDIILIDSLHGMHKKMTEGIPEEGKFKLYIETLSQIKNNNGLFVRWADIRLLRRIIRDRNFRNTDPDNTIRHWHYVRRSELRYIVSKIKNANAVINSYLAYELPVMKYKTGSFFTDFIEKYKSTDNNTDAIERAKRLMELFDEITEYKNEKIIPEDSLLREFIGNSRYKY